MKRSPTDEIDAELATTAAQRWAMSFKLEDIPKTLSRMKVDLDRARRVGNIELTEWLETDMDLLLDRLVAARSLRPMIHR